MKFSIAAAAVTIGAVLLSGCSGNGAFTQGATGGSGSGMTASAAAGGTSFSAKLRQAMSAEAALGGLSAAGPISNAVTPDESKAAAYCKQTGGTVYMRRPEYDTNDPNPLVLAGRKGFCQYTSTSDGSRIHILLATLYTQKPSLAALAYIFAPPTGSCQGNPASCYCSYLGGSDQFGGDSGAGGSWVNPKSEDVDLEACIFPDMSSIDSWGLAYHANGIIRGIDLTTVMRYKYPSIRKRS